MTSAHREQAELEQRTLDALTGEHERYVRAAVLAADIRRTTVALEYLDRIDRLFDLYEPTATLLLEQHLSGVADRLADYRAEIRILRTRFCEDALRR